MPLTLDNPLLEKPFTLLTLPPQGWEEHRLFNVMKLSLMTQIS